MSIRIEPAELRFPFALNTATVQKLRILAVGASTTFKIKTTNPKRYSVRPNLGIAWMGAAAEVTVQLGAFKELPGDLAKCKDKFQVLSLVLSDCCHRRIRAGTRWDPRTGHEASARRHAPSHSSATALAAPRAS